ncbi:MAG: DUF4202 domain-containing protein [Bacteroidota bacterium]|nr:DUF4202 domain-containing protein [Bacteroidota bacterium]
MITDQKRFEAAIARFDELNSEDPHTEYVNGKAYPKELLYALRMTDWLNKIEPGASEALQLAVRCQHLCRWKIQRDEYPMDRQGYHVWRTILRKKHAEWAGEALKEVGYDQETIDRVQFLVLKKQLKVDPEVQLLEDIVCLVFLENYFLDFAQSHEDEKVVEIIQKSWVKMTPRGQQLALNLDMPPKARSLVAQALAE